MTRPFRLGITRSFSSDVVQNGSRSHAEPFGNLPGTSSGRFHDLHRTHGLVAVSGGAVALATGSISAHARPALGRHVSHVVQLRPQKQMSRVHTRSVIARMEDEEAPCNRTVHDCPRQAMRKPAFLRREHDFETAVAMLLQPPKPQPTLVGVFPIDLRPEACNVTRIHGMYSPVGQDLGRVDPARGHLCSTVYTSVAV